MHESKDINRLILQIISNVFKFRSSSDLESVSLPMMNGWAQIFTGRVQRTIAVYKSVVHELWFAYTVPVDI